MKYAWIAGNQSHWPVPLACDVLGVSASQPFHSDSDKAFTRFRAVAKLVHDLQSLEEQLRTLYNAASELVSQDLEVLVALPDLTSRARKKVPRETPASAAVKSAMGTYRLS